MWVFLFYEIFIGMKNLIKRLLRENIQLADKVYFNSGKLTPENKETILKITNGDPYTKIVTDVYYDMLGSDYVDLKKLSSTYEQIKNYNKNVFPIKGFNINGVENMSDFLLALKQREKIINLFSNWPSVAKRNMKDDIRTERNGREMNDYLNDLEYADSNLSQLQNRNETARNKILAKIFINNTTLDDVIDFLDDKESLLGGTELTRKQIGQILKQDKETVNQLSVKYNKGNIMVIEVSGPQGIKEIGCNSLWCFTYNRDGNSNWNDWFKNSTNDICYVIIDFSKPSDSEEFMHVLTKPLMYDYSDYGTTAANRLYTMSNRDIHDEDDEEYGYNINNYIERLIDLPTAIKIMDFDIEQPKEKKKKQKYVNPAQLSLDLNEIKKQLLSLQNESTNKTNT
jgi:hypothetical protein